MNAIPDLTRAAPESGAGPSDPFRLLVESWPGIVIIFDERGEPVWKNAAATRLAITTVRHDFRHSPAALAAWGRALEGLPPTEPVTVQFPDARGVIRVLNLRFAPFFEAQGQRQIACLLSVRDSAEERLEIALEIARSGAWEMHVPSGRVWYSEGYYRLCGADFDLARATPDFWRTRVHPDDYEGVMSAFQDYAGGRTQVFEAEYRMRHEDGRWLWLLDRSRTVERDLSGLPVRVIGFLMDITERRAAEQALREQREELRVQARIIDTIRDGVALLDHTGRILLANPAMHSLFRHSPGTLAGRELRELSTLSATAFDGLLERVHEDLAVNDCSQTEFEGACADGGKLVAACIFAPIEVRGERCIVAVLSDMTERKRLEREMLLVATREQQRIGSDLHDGLGQQLTGIALLLKGLVSRLGRPRHPVSKDDIERIVSLVNEAIDSTRSLARGLSPVPATGDGLALALEALARQTRQLHRVEVTFEDALPEQPGLDDNTATHLYRIAQEAIGNALRHGRPSRIALVLRAGDGGAVELEISDDGDGFDRRARQATTGLGLKIMRFRARMIGGDVVIESTPGAGTTIRAHCAAPGAA